MEKSKLNVEAFDEFFEKIAELTLIQRVLIGCVIIGLMIGAFVYFVYMPKADKINRLERQVKGLEQKLTIAKSKAKQLKEFQDEYKAAELEFAVAKRALPDSNEIPNLLANISQSGQDSGLEFLLFQPKKEVMKDFYAEIPVEIEVRGGYHQTGMFFDKIARLSRIVNIGNIKVERPAGNTGKTVNKLDISCTAVTYKFVDKPKDDKKKKKTTRRSRRRK